MPATQSRNPQPLSTRSVVLASALAAAAAITAFVQPWEDPPGGPALIPYRDIIGVWTWCSGATQGPRKPRYTPAECEAITKSDVVKTMTGLAGCVHRPLLENEWVAVGSLAYNAGVRAICGSTLVRMVNSGQPAALWCRQILRWDKAGGRKIKGLTRRREAEYRVCIGG